ncbi:CHAT domain-containing protein [Nostoc sp.]|uniref:CHAT domain-containing protein n=1 Tax=Nostoc sp. TaxID=1180 RepID=UPI002FF5F893
MNFQLPYNSKAYLDLLHLILKTVAQSKDNLQIVYSVLQANLDKLDEFLAHIMQAWALSTLPQAEPEVARGIAEIIVSFCILLRQFPLGDKASHLEIIITGHEIASNVFTRREFPHDWGIAQNNLGNAYLYRIHGDHAENLEMAIAYFRRALQVRTREAFPKEWAITQNNLGEAYRNRILGDPAENLEVAIAAFQSALQVITLEEFPLDWATAQNNLGNAYRNRILGNLEENLAQAIQCFQHALQVFTRETAPQDWAMVQNNLGNAYLYSVREHYTQDLPKAIRCYEQALTVYTEEDFPLGWALAYNNLGIAYLCNSEGNLTENLERAIHCFQQALRIRTPEASLKDWAMTQNNLGAAYRDLGKVDEAIHCFGQVLEVYQPGDFPVECLTAGRNLGNLAFRANRWQEAIAGYSPAIEAVEQSRSWANTDKRRQEILSAAIDVYAKMVQACINTDQTDRALEYVERSKARNLVELLAARDLYPRGNVPQTVIEELDRLRREIVTEQRRIEMRSGVGEIANLETLPALAAFQESRTYLNQLQQELDELIRQDIQPYDSTFSLTQRVELVTFEQMRDLLPNSKTALIEWYIAEETFLAFIVAPHSQTPFVWQSSTQDYQALMAWISTYLTTYYDNKQQWQSTLNEQLQQLATILHLDYLLSVIPSDCSQLILIPHRFLHLFPLHVLPVGEGRSRLPSETQPSDALCLLDKFSGGVRYAPSCQLLQLTQSWNRTNFSHLFGVQNPTLDLTYSDIEMAIIRQAFHPHAEILVKAEARKEAIGNQRLQAAHCVHFACHGIFDLESPLRSALVLAGVDLKALELERCLTLGEIFGLNLSQCRLVALSACETGLTDPTSLSDEYIGLPSSFLYAGSPSVVSSLWTISDISTAFLVAKFYQNLQQGSSVAVALNQAQRWLRDATGDELQQWMEEQQLPLNSTLKMSLQRRFRQNRQPFQEPFYWAAFCAIGQ